MFRTTVSDPDQLREMTQGSNYEVIQTSPGRLHASMLHDRVGDMLFSQGNFNVSIRCRGMAQPEHVRLGVLLQVEGRASLWGMPAQPGDVIVYPPGVEIYSLADPAAYLHISLPPEQLVARHPEHPFFSDPGFWKRRVWSVPHADRQRLLRSIHARQLSGLSDTILDAFLDALSAAHPASPRLDPDVLLLRAFEDFADSLGPRCLPRTAAVAQHLGVSKSTLERAIQKSVHNSPKSYVRRRKLAEVHAALLHDADHWTIGQIARRVGLDDARRFAREYRAQYGESPFETRQRSLHAKAANLANCDAKRP